MSNRFPLTIDTSTSTIEELPSGDNLDLTGSDISSVGNITAGNSISANYFVGTLYGTANNAVTANSANTAGTVTTNAQPNITSVGNLANLTVNGTSTLGNIGNVKITGGTNNQLIKTDGNGNLSFTTVQGDSYMLNPVRVATTQNITLSGTQTIDGVSVIAGDRVLVRRQSVPNQNGIYIVDSSTWTRASDFDTGAATLKGGVTVVAQEGTQLGGSSFYCTNSGTITIGSTSILFGRTVGDNGLVAIWSSQGAFDNKASASANSGALAIGVSATAALDSTAVGYSANSAGQGATTYGYQTKAGSNGTAVGVNAGNGAASGFVALGINAGQTAAGSTIGIGAFAQSTSTTGANAIAVGYRAGYGGQGANAIAIGGNAGDTSQGANSIAIGRNAGIASQHANSIILNSTGANLNSDGTDRFYVKPVRNTNTANLVFYNNSSGEVSYSSNLQGLSGNIETSANVTALNVTANANVTANNIVSGYFVVLANTSAANLANTTGVAGAIVSVSDQDYQPAYWSVSGNVWKYVSNRANV